MRPRKQLCLSVEMSAAERAAAVEVSVEMAWHVRADSVKEDGSVSTQRWGPYYDAQAACAKATALVDALKVIVDGSNPQASTPFVYVRGPCRADHVALNV